MHLSDFSNEDLSHIGIKAVYAAALCYGLISDVKSLRIPNAVSLAVAALFFVHRWLVDGPGTLNQHLLAAGLTFAVTFGLYAAGLMGAGDVKLIAALMLWAGLRDGLNFLIVMTLIGGALAAFLLVTGRAIMFWPSLRRYIPSRRLKNWAVRGIFPYGIAICTAGLLFMPAFFRVG